MATKVKNKKELSTNNYIAAVAIGTLILVLICGLIAKNLIGTTVVNSKLIVGKAKAKSDLDKKLQNIPVLLSNYNQLGFRKNLISDGLPTSGDFPQIISIMQNVAGSSGVDLKNVAPSDSGTSPTAAPSGGATPYDFSVTVEGNYSQILSMVKNVEQSVRPIRFLSSDISGDSGDLTVNFALETYYKDKADISDKTEEIK